MPRMDQAKHSFSENETEKYDNLIGIYLLKASSKNTRTRWEICSKLTIKTQGTRTTSIVSIVNFEHVIAG